MPYPFWPDGHIAQGDSYGRLQEVTYA
jgi:hypothetical protein